MLEPNEEAGIFEWACWLFVMLIVSALVIAGMVEVTQGQQQTIKLQPQQIIELQHFPVPGTSLYCTAAVTKEFLVNQESKQASPFGQARYDWIDCRPFKEMGITPTPTPKPTPPAVG